MYNGELDLLLLLLRTVGRALDLLVISEMSTTFSGVPKRMFLNETLALQPQLLQPWAERILYVPLTGDALAHSAAAGFDTENLQRHATRNEAIARGQIRNGDLLLEGDVDEIPRAAALWLLHLCALPDAALPLSLALRKYYYSFEWMTLTYWTPLKVTRYGSGLSMSQPNDSRRGGRMAAQLADAGWHCSWCFATLAEFAQKAASYSHTEHNTAGILQRDWLQRAVCEGRDLAGRWGEYHTWADMLRHLPGEFVRQRSAAGLPPALLRHADQYAYLLPGRCMRHDYRGEYAAPP